MITNKFLVTAAFVLLALVGCLAALRLEIVAEPVLILSDRIGKTVASFRLRDGFFEHVFVHSVNKTPVHERFVVEGSGTDCAMKLYELRYQSIGSGMPSDAENGFRLEDDEFILSMDRSFKKIPVSVSPLEGHGIVIGKAFTPFTKWFRTGSLVVLTARMTHIIRIRRFLYERHE